MSRLKLQAEREILYRSLTLPKIEKRTDNHVIWLPGANPLPIWSQEEK
jgi:hypothetical protein